VHHPLPAILAQHPTLRISGFDAGVPSTLVSAPEHVPFFLGHTLAFDAACTWIRKHLPPERSRRYFASHVLAHIAACETGPIPNGVFIAAMIHCGHPFIRDRQQSPHAYFALSTRRVVALDRRSLALHS